MYYWAPAMQNMPSAGAGIVGHPWSPPLPTMVSFGRTDCGGE